jgi:IclR family KDG regulon transcriptional repressor
MLGTVLGAGRVLDLFTDESPEWGPTTVARELDIAKSQAYQLLTSLCAIGLLRRSHGGQFRLGWRMLTLGRNLLRAQFPEGVATLLRCLAQAFGEPVHLMALERNHLEVIASRAGTCGTDVLLPSDGWDPFIDRCAMGKCLLAGLRDARLAELLATATGVTADLGPARDPANLVAELDVIRRERVAIDRGAVAATLRAVAVPVRDARGDTLAAVGLWTTASRWAHAGEEMTRAVVGVGRRIETAVQAEPRDRPNRDETASVKVPIAA